MLGPALTGPVVGYGVVYHFEILMLFITLVAIGPMVRSSNAPLPRSPSKFGLADIPA